MGTFFLEGIAGMVSKTSIAPLERIKILLQVHHKTYKHYGECIKKTLTSLQFPHLIKSINLSKTGVFSGLNQIVKNESFLALYRGNGAQMVTLFFLNHWIVCELSGIPLTPLIEFDNTMSLSVKRLGYFHMPQCNSPASKSIER